MILAMSHGMAIASCQRFANRHYHRKMSGFCDIDPHRVKGKSQAAIDEEDRRIKQQ